MVRLDGETGVREGTRAGDHEGETGVSPVTSGGQCGAGGLALQAPREKRLRMKSLTDPGARELSWGKGCREAGELRQDPTL